MIFFLLCLSELCFKDLVSDDIFKAIEAQETFFVTLFSNDIIAPDVVGDIKKSGCEYHETMKLVFGKGACTINTHQVRSM